MSPTAWSPLAIHMGQRLEAGAGLVLPHLRRPAGAKGVYRGQRAPEALADLGRKKVQAGCNHRGCYALFPWRDPNANGTKSKAGGFGKGVRDEGLGFPPGQIRPVLRPLGGI